MNPSKPKHIRDLLERVSKPELIQEHGLAGLHATLMEDSPFEKQRLENLQRNTLLMCQYEEIQKTAEASSLELAPLKGIYLLENLYKDWGLRPMSDIDILISPGDEVRFFSALAGLGFKPQTSSHWMANHFKHLFSKSVEDLEVVVEVHTDLFWHLNQNLEVESFQNEHPHCLENHFLFLCGHLAFQHNFLKLFWLVDIFEMGRRFASEMDFDWLKSKAQDLQLENSLNACIFACRILIDRGFLLKEYPQLPAAWYQNILTDEFLLAPRQHHMRYFALKHLLKDELGTAIKYDWKWFTKSLSQG